MQATPSRCRAPYLAPRSPSPKLSAILEAPVEVHSDWPVIHDCARDVLYCILCILARVVHDKGKAAGRHLVLVKPHDDALDISCP